MPCTPEELAELADLVSRGKLGETQGISLDVVGPENRVQQNPVMHEVEHKTGFLHFGRTQRAVFGDEGKVQFIDPLIQTVIKGDNVKVDFHKQFIDAWEPMGLSWLQRKVTGIPGKLDEQVGLALEKVGRDGQYFGRPGEFDDKVVKVAQNVRKIYDTMFKEYGLDPDTYINGYRPLLRKNPGGIMWRMSEAPDELAFKQKLIRPEDIVFYRELERKGLVTDPDLRASTTFTEYINGLVRAKIVAPAIEDLEKTRVNEYLGFKLYQAPEGRTIPMANDATAYNAWKELTHHVLGGPTPLDRSLTSSFQKITRSMGFDTDTRGLYKVTQGMNSLFYAGALGLRPASAIRQLGQLVPSWAQLGTKYTMIGMKRAMEEGVEPLIQRNIISSPLEHLVEAVDVQGRLGRAVNAVSEASLKMFSAVDRQVRAATAYGAEAKFMDAHAAGTVEKLKMLPELKDEVMRLYKAGNITGAMERYTFTTVQDLQYAFGKANRPQMFRGALGNMVGVFMSYPLNTFELGKMMVKQGLPTKWGGAGDPMPLIRLMFATGAIGIGGSEFLGADLRSMTMLGAMPNSMAFPKTALDTWNVGRTNVEWLTGNAFAGGETNYHKYQRTQYDKEFARGMRMFIPGGLAFFEDLPKVLDEGSIARLLALTPKADVINEQARQKSRELARERYAEKPPGLAPLRPLQ